MLRRGYRAVAGFAGSKTEVAVHRFPDSVVEPDTAVSRTAETATRAPLGR
jgi:hypothetical protein